MSRSKLDVAANVAIIAACIVASMVLVRREFFPPRPETSPVAVSAGDHLDLLRDVVPAGTERALVIAIAPDCRFCNESMSFYARLLDRRNRSKSLVKVVAAVPSADARTPEQAKLAANGIRPDALVQIDFRRLKIPGTPTVLLVDRQGKVLSVWMGKLDTGAENEILKAF